MQIVATLRKDGRLQSSVYVENIFTGKKERKYVYGYSEAEIEFEKKQLLQAAKNQILFLQDATFSDWYLECLKTKREYKQINEVTEESYKNIITNHILPYLPEKIKMSEIKVFHIKNILRQIKGDRTKEYTYTILNSIFSEAVFEQVITDNPCKFVRKPKAKAKPAALLTPEIYASLMNAVKDTQMYYILFLGFDCGARRGELCALRWNKFHPKEKILKLKKSLKITKEKGLFEGTTKSPHGEREIILSDAAIEKLLEWKKILRRNLFRAGLPWNESDYIFRSPTDLSKPLRPDYITSTMTKLRKKLNLPNRTCMHSFRHTHATVLAEGNLSPKKIQLRLGHASAAFTMDTYVHNSASMQDGIIEAVESAEKRFNI